MVVDKAVRRLLLTEVFDRVGPENVAHETLRRGLAEPVNLSVDLQDLLFVTRGELQGWRSDQSCHEIVR